MSGLMNIETLISVNYILNMVEFLNFLLICSVEINFAPGPFESPKKKTPKGESVWVWVYGLVWVLGVGKLGMARPSATLYRGGV